MNLTLILVVRYCAGNSNVFTKNVTLLWLVQPVVSWTNQKQEEVEWLLLENSAGPIRELLTNEIGAVSQRLSKLKLARENLAQ
jgi:hypothetical protein